MLKVQHVVDMSQFRNVEAIRKSSTVLNFQHCIELKVQHWSVDMGRSLDTLTTCCYILYGHFSTRYHTRSWKHLTKVKQFLFNKAVHWWKTNISHEGHGRFATIFIFKIQKRIFWFIMCFLIANLPVTRLFIQLIVRIIKCE